MADDRFEIVFIDGGTEGPGGDRRPGGPEVAPPSSGSATLGSARSGSDVVSPGALGDQFAQFSETISKVSKALSDLERTIRDLSSATKSRRPRTAQSDSAEPDSGGDERYALLAKILGYPLDPKTWPLPPLPPKPKLEQEATDTTFGMRQADGDRASSTGIIRFKDDGPERPSDWLRGIIGDANRELEEKRYRDAEKITYQAPAKASRSRGRARKKKTPIVSKAVKRTAVAAGVGTAIIRQPTTATALAASAAVKPVVTSIGKLAAKGVGAAARMGVGALGRVAAGGSGAIASVAGGAGAALSTVASAAAAAGPAMAAVGTAAAGVATVLTILTDQALRRADEIAKYSGSISAAKAMADVRQIEFDSREANEMGDQYAGLIDAVSRIMTAFQEIVLPIKKAILEMLVPVLETIASTLEWIAEKIWGKQKPDDTGMIDKFMDMVAGAANQLEQIKHMEDARGLKSGAAIRFDFAGGGGNRAPGAVGNAAMMLGGI